MRAPARRSKMLKTSTLALVTIAANNFAVPLINSEAQPWDLHSVAELEMSWSSVDCKQLGIHSSQHALKYGQTLPASISNPIKRERVEESCASPGEVPPPMEI
ncbi:hypothetical protein STEG23_029943, partial [Scotinomys teguina]